MQRGSLQNDKNVKEQKDEKMKMEIMRKLKTK